MKEVKDTILHLNEDESLDSQNWSADKQLNAGLKLLDTVKLTSETEPIPENFAIEFGFKDEEVDLSLF
jgi:hypothetical protein